MENNQNNAQMPDESMQRTQKAEKRKRKIIKGILIFSAVVIVLSLITSMIDPNTFVKRLFGEKEEAQQIAFYPIDDEMNSLGNPDYLEMDRRLFVHNPFEGTTYSVEKSELEGEDDFVEFFYNYIEAIRSGDADALWAMYSPNCNDIKNLPTAYTVQMVYDITVYPQTEGGNVIAYRVDYKIHRNNGTFRKDVGSDTIRPLLFTLVQENGELKIGSVVPYTSYVRN
jgi:hypothetical protein